MFKVLKTYTFNSFYRQRHATVDWINEKKNNCSGEIHVGVVGEELKIFSFYMFYYRAQTGFILNYSVKKNPNISFLLFCSTSLILQVCDFRHIHCPFFKRKKFSLLNTFPPPFSLI